MTSTARAPIKKSAIGAEALTRPPKDLLQYNKRYQIVICTACQYAIQPAAIARHLKETHAIHRHHRRPYTDYVATLPLSHPSQLIDKGTSARQVVSEDDDFPVPGLPVISGLQCLSPDCGHLCASVKRMQNHWLVDHQTSGFAALDWQSVPLQTFFRGNLLRYFTHPALAVMRPSDESTKCINQQVGAIQDAWMSHETLDEFDKDLLAHYLHSTHASLANRHGNSRLWQISVPRIATSNSFLRHGILALSARHLLNNEHVRGVDHERLTETAGNHHDKAMRAFQAIIDVNPSTALECHGIIAFVHLHTLFSFAAFAIKSPFGMGSLFLTDSSRDDLDYVSPWLYYVRHGCHLVCGFWDTIGNGPLASLAASWDIPIMAEDGRSSKIAVVLSAVLDSGRTWTSQTSNPEKSPCAQAASELALALNAAYELGSALTVWDAIRLWPLTVSVDFVSEIKEETPGAMMLVACYCIILEKLDGAWFAQGLSSRLLSNICTRLQKGQREVLEEVRGRIISILG